MYDYVDVYCYTVEMFFSLRAAAIVFLTLSRVYVEKKSNRIATRTLQTIKTMSTIILPQDLSTLDDHDLDWS
jgi:hypothetical protein